MKRFFLHAILVAAALSCAVTAASPDNGTNAANSVSERSLRLAGGAVSSSLTLSTALTTLDTDLIDDVERRSFRYFLEQTDLHTGLTMDRAPAARPKEAVRSKGLVPAADRVSSIAATGFGLTAFCIAVDRRWIGPETAKARVLPALRFFANRAPQEHGWFYHFLNASTGARAWHSEVSSIDTALLLAGVLTARQCFHDDPEIVSLATTIYNRVDFPWMLDAGGNFFTHGWTPENGFIHYRWDTYSELLILYALGIGSPTHPVSPDIWDTWSLPVTSVGQYTYIGGGPLFIHQYSQAWLDLRESSRGSSQSASSFSVLSGAMSGSGAAGPGFHPNYFANSVAATRSQQELFSKMLSQKYPGYNENLWGVTASDSSNGYMAWGNSPDDPRIDGTIVPSAAGGSLMFAPDICLSALRAMLVQFGDKIYGRYGFADAFNPTSGWTSQYVLGIDAGITLLSAENLRSGSVWHWFMSNAEPVRALQAVGIGPWADLPTAQIHVIPVGVPVLSAEPHKPELISRKISDRQ